MLEKPENILDKKLTQYRKNQILSKMILSSEDAEEILKSVETKYNLEDFHNELKLVFDVYFRKKTKFFWVKSFLFNFWSKDIKELIKIIDYYFLNSLDTLIKKYSDSRRNKSASGEKNIEMHKLICTKKEKFKNLKKRLRGICNTISIEKDEEIL